jgi:hypothetical protein
MKKTELCIHQIKNLTNGIDIVKASADHFFDLVEFSPEKIGLVLPKAVTRGLLVTVDSILFLNGTQHAFAMNGKIIDSSANPDKSFSIVVELHHYDHNLWNEFISLKNQEQLKIDTLLQKMKGES